MTADDALFVYLCYGRSPAAARELRYALETLAPEIGGDLSRIVLYAERGQDFAERGQDFADLGVRLIDVSPLLAQAFAHPYRHRLKPMILADALRRFGRPCALLDLDSFVNPGFAAAVSRALNHGAAMNHFVRQNPYSGFAFETDLPHLGHYRLDPERAQMLNSGLVAVQPAHLPLIEDAIVLIDRLWAAGLHKHDIEQFAIAETLRVGGVEIALIDDVFVHYCARWSRRYMRRALRGRKPGSRIAFGKARVRLFKASWTLRLAMRKARLSRGPSWRTT